MSVGRTMMTLLLLEATLLPFFDDSSHRYLTHQHFKSTYRPHLTRHECTISQQVTAALTIYQVL